MLFPKIPAALGRLFVGVALIIALGACATTAVVRVPPEPRVQIQPAYPFEMRRAGIEGRVVIGCIVDTAGIPRDLVVIRSTNKAFDAAALAAVTRWRFKPGTVGGQPANFRFEVPLVFALEQAAAPPTP